MNINLDNIPANNSSCQDKNKLNTINKLKNASLSQFNVEQSTIQGSTSENIPSASAIQSQTRGAKPLLENNKKSLEKTSKELDLLGVIFAKDVLNSGDLGHNIRTTDKEFKEIFEKYIIKSIAKSFVSNMMESFDNQELFKSIIEHNFINNQNDEIYLDPNIETNLEPFLKPLLAPEIKKYPESNFSHELFKENSLEDNTSSSLILKKRNMSQTKKLKLNLCAHQDMPHYAKVRKN